MNKHALRQAIVDHLRIDLDTARRAAQTAYETATHEENVAENKYDTLGLEASYLATGQARRMEEIRQALLLYEGLVLRAPEGDLGIALGALVRLDTDSGHGVWFFLGPEAAGVKIALEAVTVTVITPRSPLGQSLLGKEIGDEVRLAGAAHWIGAVH